MSLKQRYHYETIEPMNYDQWADRAYQQERTPVLPGNIAHQLEAIFSREGQPTFQEYQDELRWLTNLSQDLRFVWTSVQLETSGMSNIVGDYLSALGL